MATGQPKKGLAHICFMVRDLDQAIKDWQAILSVLDPEAAESFVYYEDFVGGGDVMRWATFNNPNGCEIQLMQPVNPDGPLYKRLQKHGESVHHICFVNNDLERVVVELDEAGIALTNKELSFDPNLNWQQWTFIAPKSSHGCLVELAYPYKAENGKWVSGREMIPA